MLRVAPRNRIEAHLYLSASYASRVTWDARANCFCYYQLLYRKYDLFLLSILYPTYNDWVIKLPANAGACSALAQPASRTPCPCSAALPFQRPRCARACACAVSAAAKARHRAAPRTAALAQGWAFPAV